MRLTIRSFVAASLLLAAVACGTDEDEPTTNTGFTDKQIIVDFADKVVVPTYTDLASKADALVNAVNSLAATPSAAALTAARNAWVATRLPWEQSEAFLFGPVDAKGYDPAMDSWPVNETDLIAVLNSDDALTPEFVGSLSETQKGFHTIEYLIFGDGGVKTFDQLTERELEYLVAVTVQFQGVAHALADSWTTSVDGPPYRETFATAGEAGNTAYPSLGAAAQEIVNGMIGICDEVANGKIADPFDAMDPNLVESQFSYNSLVDFKNNMESVRNAYLGNAAGVTGGRGLTDFVAAKDVALDTRFKGEIDAAITALDAIPEPFRDAISNPDAADEIEAAQAAIRKLQTTLEMDIKPLLTE